MPYLDITAKGATVIIAALNFYFAVKFFHVKNKKDEADKEKDRRIQWLKALILDHNLKYLYAFFDDLETELARLKQNGLSVDDKQAIDGAIGNHFIALRQRFIDILLAVDSRLYDGFMRFSDDLQGHLSEKIFDEGINLAHTKKFDEEIKSKLVATKTDLIKTLFNYRG